MKGAHISFVTWVYKTGLKVLGGKGLTRVWPFGAIYAFVSGTIRKEKWPETVIIDGFRLSAPPNQRAAFAIYKGEREALERRLFEREIPKGGTVVDVGANIGFYTIPFARAAGPTGKVFAFEPEPVNLGYLKKNLKENTISNVTVVSKALGDHNGKIDLFISAWNPGGHQIWDLKDKIESLPHATDEQKQLLEDEHGDVRPKILVELVTLDEYFRDYAKPIHFVKMDVEGAEGGVLAGMRDLLKRHKDIKFHFEFIPSVMRLFGTDPKAFLDELEGLGFSFYSLLNYKRGVNHLDKFTARELLARCPGNKSDEVFATRQPPKRT